MADKLTVGIDLGTSSCSVGIIREEQFTIFKDDKGNETTPSYVAFTESGRLIGHEAKDQVTINPKNTVYGIKRLIGKHHSKVMEERKKLKLPFHASPDHYSNSHITVRYKRKELNLYPKQVSAMLLVKMRKIAERNLGQNVHGAVISVPANFNSYQRQATVDAATIAGFKEINLINEPTASAFALSSQLKCEKYRNFLIADFGGGFFSLTVARVKSYDVQILASCAEDFGGLDIDQQLFDGFAKEISANLFSNVGNQRCTERLKQACEAAKKDLSHSNPCIYLTNFIDGKDVYLKVTKSDFIEVSTSVGNMFHIATQKVLREAGLRNSSIEDIVFVGKCWNISYFQESILSFFSAEKILPCIYNLTNSVLHGAAIQAVGRTVNFCLRDTIRSVEIHGKHGARDRMLSLVPNALSQKQEKIKLGESLEWNVIEVVRNIRHQQENNTIGKIEVGPRKGYNAFATAAFIYADANGIIQGELENKCAPFLHLKLFHSSHRIDTLLSHEYQFQPDEIEAQKLEEELRHLEKLEKQCLKTRQLVRNCNNLPLEMKERFDRRIEETLHWIDDNPGAMEVEYCCKKLEIQKIYNEAQESEKSMVNVKFQRKGQEDSGPQINSKGSLLHLKLFHSSHRIDTLLSHEYQFQPDEIEAQKLEEELRHLEKLEKQCLKTRQLVRNCNNLPLEMKERFDRRIEETLHWIDDNPGAMEVEYCCKKLEIQKIYNEAQESEKSMVNVKFQRKGQEDSGPQINSKGSLQSQVSISRKNNRCNSVLSPIAGSSKYSDNAPKEKLLHLSDKERQAIKATLNGKQEEQRNDNPSEYKEKVVNESIDQNIGSDKQKEVKNKNSATKCSRISSSSRNSIEEIEISKKNENNGKSDNKLEDKPYLSSEKSQVSISRKNNRCNSVLSPIAGSSKYGVYAPKKTLFHVTDNKKQEVSATLNGKQEEQRNNNPSEYKEKVVNESIDQKLGSDKQKEVKNKNSATVCSQISSSSRISIEEKEISEKNENKNGTSDKLKDKSYLSSEKEQTPLGTRTNSTNSEMKSSNISNYYNNSSSPADGRSASNSSSSDRDLISSSQKVISEPRVDPSVSATARGNTSAKSPSLQKEKNHVTNVNQNYNGDAVPSEPQKCDSKSISEQKDLEGVKEVQSIKREGYLDGSGCERSCSSESYSTASKPRHVKGKCVKLKDDFIAPLLVENASSYCYIT